jgi:CubicO group peptidase (beta-lactamase class C family)
MTTQGAALLLAVIICTSQFPLATPVRPAAIDKVVQKSAQKFMSDKHSVGLSVGVFKDNKVYTYNFGEVEKGSGERPTEHSIYEIASITKTFTGVLLAQAVIEKKVRLEDDIRTYLVGSYPNLEFKGQPIRLVHLINHTSRLPFVLPDRPELFQNPDPLELPKILTKIESTYTRADFYEDLHKVKLDKVPGTEFKYSNAAAQLLGYILEGLYGLPYEQLVIQKIAKPLRMRETKITLSQAEKKRLAKGHYENGSIALPATPQTQAAGGLRSSVSDMLKYMKFHLNENNEVTRLSHKTSWGEIKYYASGLNWQMVKTAQGHRKIWQSGGSFGFSSYCAVFPDLNVGIVLLSNESDQNSQGRLNTMADEILAGITLSRASTAQ